MEYGIILVAVAIYVDLIFSTRRYHTPFIIHVSIYDKAPFEISIS